MKEKGRKKNVNNRREQIRRLGETKHFSLKSSALLWLKIIKCKGGGTDQHDAICQVGGSYRLRAEIA